MIENKVVTVSVFTYNSSKFVLETLDSIKNQTYPSLVLQICDDCSMDNTIEICNKWIKENNERFVKTKIIIPDYNTGISGNFNRALDACETEWFKSIAGDDLLKPECIEEYMKYVLKNDDVIVAFSRVKLFGINPGRINYDEVFDYSFFYCGASIQREMLTIGGKSIPAPTAFFNIKKTRALGVRADERIPMVEDHPLWINLILKGVKFDFIDKELVCYRIGESGLSSGIKQIASLKKTVSSHAYYYFYIFPVLYEKNREKALNQLFSFQKQSLEYIDSLEHSHSLKLGSFLLAPFKLGIVFLKELGKTIKICHRPRNSSNSPE